MVGQKVAAGLLTNKHYKHSKTRSNVENSDEVHRLIKINNELTEEIHSLVKKQRRNKSLQTVVFFISCIGW